MGARVRQLFVLSMSMCVMVFFSLLSGCGSSSQPNSSSSQTSSASSAGSSSSNPGSGSSGSPGSGSSGSGSGSGSSSYVSFAYTASASAINGYGVNADGSLTAVTGSPYATTTDMTIVTNGANVYSVDSTGATLNVFALSKTTGALTAGSSTSAETGNPNPADIVGSLALDHTGTTLYVGEEDSSGDDGYGVYQVGSAPTATEIQYDGNGEQFGPALVFSPDNKYAYSGNCYQATWVVFSYVRGTDGKLTPPGFSTGAYGPPVTTPGDFYCPVAFAVSAKNILAIAYATQPQSGPEMIGLYTINSDGTLTAIQAPQAAATTNPRALNFDPTGTYLAAAGTAGVQVFQVGAGGVVTPVGAIMDAGTAFEQVAWDKSNHVFATSSSQLYSFNSASGVLTAANGSPYGGGGGLTVLPLQ